MAKTTYPVTVTNKRLFEKYFDTETNDDGTTIYVPNENIDLKLAGKIFAGSTSSSTLPPWVKEELKNPEGNGELYVDDNGELVIQNAYEVYPIAAWDGDVWKVKNAYDDCYHQFIPQVKTPE